jgi:hypothetical protein
LGDVALARTLAAQQLTISAEFGISYWLQLAQFIQGAIAVRSGDLIGGIAAMRHAIDAMRASGAAVGVSYLLCMLAEAHLAAGEVAGARSVLEDACALMAGNRNALYAAETKRIEAEIVLAEVEGGTDRAHRRAAELYEAALDIADTQAAYALTLRAAMGRARLFAAGGQLARAIDVLTRERAAFSEGNTTADVAAATALLEAWSGMRKQRPG